MAITLRDFINFPFNNGKGIKAIQVADVDLPKIDKNVEALMTGRLGYVWKFAIDTTQNFTEDSFIHLLTSASSEFPELISPTFTELDTYFYGIATPLNVSEASIIRSGGYSQNLFDAGVSRRIPIPLYINNIPHRVYISNYHANPLYQSAIEYILHPRLRLSGYKRYVITTDLADFPTDSDEWSYSNTSVALLNNFNNVNKYCHIALPRGVAPEPNFISVSNPNAVNIANLFTINSSGTLLMVNNVPYDVYSSNVKLAYNIYSAKDLIILPERSNIQYYREPTTLTNNDIGFTYYAGFYNWTMGEAHPLEPVTEALINAGVGVSESTTEEIVMPMDSDEAIYSPNNDNYYVRYILLPSAQDTITGIYQTPPITYQTLAEIMTWATNWWTEIWSAQPNNPISIGGVNYDVFLNRQSISLWGSSPISGQRLHIFRT